MKKTYETIDKMTSTIYSIFALTIIILKCAHIINISWAIALLPIYAPIAFCILILTIIFICACFINI